jgi:hypothetical protein
MRVSNTKGKANHLIRKTSSYYVTSWPEMFVLTYENNQNHMSNFKKWIKWFWREDWGVHGMKPQFLSMEPLWGRGETGKSYSWELSADSSRKRASILEWSGDQKLPRGLDVDQRKDRMLSSLFSVAIIECTDWVIDKWKKSIWLMVLRVGRSKRLVLMSAQPLAQVFLLHHKARQSKSGRESSLL